MNTIKEDIKADIEHLRGDSDLEVHAVGVDLFEESDGTTEFTEGIPPKGNPQKTNNVQSTTEEKPSVK